MRHIFLIGIFFEVQENNNWTKVHSFLNNVCTIFTLWKQGPVHQTFPSKPHLTSAEGPCFHKLKKHCFKNKWILANFLSLPWKLNNRYGPVPYLTHKEHLKNLVISPLKNILIVVWIKVFSGRKLPGKVMRVGGDNFSNPFIHKALQN